MTFASASTMIKSARAAGFVEVHNTETLESGKVVNRGTIINLCPQCDQKRFIRFKHKDNDKLVDKCYGCDHKVDVAAGKSTTTNHEPGMCPCGCGPLPSKRHTYAHGAVCKARIKAGIKTPMKF